jgi:hypothetical protein
MNRCYAFSRCWFIRCPPRHLAIEDLLTQLLRRNTPTVRRIIRCWRTLRQYLTVCIFKSVGWTAAPLLVHPVLKLQSWRISVLIQMKRRIDRRCPHSDRQIIRCYWLCCFFSAIDPTHLGEGLSVHPTVSTSFGQLHSVPTTPTLCTDGTVGSSDGVFSSPFLRGFDPWKIDYLLKLACGIFASLGPRNVYKDMLNNMVSPIDHVVMNHQNQTQTNGIWVHVRYTAQ